MLKLLIDMPVEESFFSRLQSDKELEICFVPPPDAALPSPEECARAWPEELIGDADILFGTELPANHAIMTQLKFIQISSAGFTQMIGKGMPERGIRCCNAAGVQDIPIAEWNVAMMINLRRNLRRMIANQELAIWDRNAVFQQEIHGLTLGIFGYGGIGRQTARLARTLGLNVHVLTRDGGLPRRENMYTVEGTGDPDGRFVDRFFANAERKAFFGGIDFLVMAIPLTPSNTGTIDFADLSMLKPTAFVLNPARGPLIVEADLIRALERRVIAGAALDTHYHYPMPPDHVFWRMPNVILTPHISGSSQSNRFLARIWEIFVRNVANYRKKYPLLNELKTEVL